MARFQLDRLYLKNQNHKLRLRLRQLTKIIRDSEGVGVLGTVLEVIGSSVSATWAVVLRWTRDGLIPIGEWNWVGETLESALPSDVVRELMMEDLSELGPQQFPPPFEEAAIIVPLYEEDQIGALLVGPSRNQRGYSETEMESLRDAGDILTNLLRTPPVEGQALTRLEEAALSGLIDQVCLSEEDLIRLVAMSLRKLHDYQYLGSTPLVRLRVVESCLECTESGPTNHIDLGKAVSIVLRDAVDQLRPDQDEPAGSLPRNWYPYIILRDAYLNGVPNREIMARLYISEGTFNRTRRDAIRSVARLLNEMEAAMV